MSAHLTLSPEVDVDSKQKFQFGGIDALLNYEIDMPVTPDLLSKQRRHFEPVFDYKQVLVVSGSSIAALPR